MKVEELVEKIWYIAHQTRSDKTTEERKNEITTELKIEVADIIISTEEKTKNEITKRLRLTIEDCERECDRLNENEKEKE